MSNYFGTKGGHQFTQWILFAAGTGTGQGVAMPPNPLDVIDKNTMIAADMQVAYNEEIINRFGMNNSAEYYNMEALPSQQIRYASSNIYESAVNLRQAPNPTRRLN
jgi:hypothetical protein